MFNVLGTVNALKQQFFSLQKDPRIGFKHQPFIEIPRAPKPTNWSQAIRPGVRQAQLQTWLEILSEVGRQCFFSSSKWFEIWHLFVCSPKVIKNCCSSKVHWCLWCFCLGTAFHSPFRVFWKKQMKVGHWWNSPWAQNPLIYRWPIDILPSHLETASFARLVRYAKLLPEMPGSKMWETPPEWRADSWNFSMAGRWLTC